MTDPVDAPPGPLRLEDLSRDALVSLAYEYLLAGHMIDRAGMPLVLGGGIEVMRDIAIEEWMGASPIYTKRTQRLFGFEGDTVACAFKAMQLEIGAPLQFMDFRFEVDDDHHGSFYLQHCGALMDVEPMGEDFVVAMCHDIEDPTFDATGWATNPRMRLRPVHRPPRLPADRHPHCAWTAVIDPETEPTPTPVRAERIGATLAAGLPLGTVGVLVGDGRGDYSGDLDPELRLEDFDSALLRAFVGEVGLQGHLLVMSFASAVGDVGLVAGETPSAAAIADVVGRQFTGVAGVAAGRLKAALGLGESATDVATMFRLHPAFQPASYIDWTVLVDGEDVRLELGDCAAVDESRETSWMSVLGSGRDGALSAIAMAVDPCWRVRSEGPRRWTAYRTDVPAPEMDEVTLVRFSTGADFQFRR